MNQKIENELNLSLELDNAERNKTENLNTGYDAGNNEWELIIKYTGEVREEVEALGGSIKELLGGYGIVTIPENSIRRLANLNNVLLVEKANRLIYETEYSKLESCITKYQRPPYNLSGEGVIVAIIDSGIDYLHPEFRDSLGFTRISVINNQETGATYNREEINAAIERGDRNLAFDANGHGTHVAGIAAGNTGVAGKAEIIVVKLGTDRYFNTARLMEAVDFCVQYAIKVGKPMAVNLSFGNNYGSHNGTSLVETYLDYVAEVWKLSIVVGTGNEADKRIHTSGRYTNELQIGRYEPSVNIQLWKNPGDRYEIILENPGGNRVILSENAGMSKYSLNGDNIYVYRGEPSPYSNNQEILFQIIPEGEYVNDGIWKIILVPNRIISGEFDMWLADSNYVSGRTGFLNPTPELTLTIPSTAYKVISVGAYDARRMSYAIFSGRGYTRTPVAIKPDIVAPGVSIVSASAGTGGYVARSGTSMAAPFVTGSAALLMEWGIVRGNDLFLYGEKIKATLISGARRVPGVEEWPNREWGWGTLCLTINDY
jgi:subtilisin family serine protease